MKNRTLVFFGGFLMLASVIANAQETTICDTAPGKWQFGNGELIEVKENGSFYKDGTYVGKWRCNSETMLVELAWANGEIKRYVLPGNDILVDPSSRGEDGNGLVARKMTGKEGPADLMDKSKPGGVGDPMNMGQKGTQPKEKEKKKKGDGTPGVKGGN